MVRSKFLGPSMHRGPWLSLRASQQDYGNLNTMNVWRSARSHAAAEVEALSPKGMDET